MFFNSTEKLHLCGERGQRSEVLINLCSTVEIIKDDM